MDQQEIRDNVTQLIRSGHRDRAKSWLMGTLHVSEDEAEKLVKAIELENPYQNIIPAHAIDRANAFVSTSGCITLVLRGIGVFFALITLSMYAFAVIIYFVYNHFAPDAVSVYGTVIELRENEEGSLAPVIEYSWNDEAKQYESTSYSRPAAYDVGETLTLLVNPENPDEAIIDTFNERYLVSVIFGSVGTLFLIFTVILFAVARKIKPGFEKSV